MTNRLDIFNMALGLCGQASTINDPDANNVLANACRSYYPSSLKTCLQAGWWNFAQAYDYLTLRSAMPGTPENPNGDADWTNALPMPPWLYSYLLPKNCIQMRLVISQMDTQRPSKFARYAQWNAATNVYDNVIGTNASKAIAVYTAEITDTSMFDAQFTDALVHRLAHDICLRITGNDARKKELAGDYQRIVTQALASDANEGFSILDYTPDSLAVRGLQQDNFGDLS